MSDSEIGGLFRIIGSIFQLLVKNIAVSLFFKIIEIIAFYIGYFFLKVITISLYPENIQLEFKHAVRNDFIALSFGDDGGINVLDLEKYDNIWWIKLLGSIVLLASLIFGVWHYYTYSKRMEFSDILNIESPPALEVVDCYYSPNIYSQDKRKICLLQIESQSVDILLSGYSFDKEQTSMPSYPLGFKNHDFLIKQIYTTKDKYSNELIIYLSENKENIIIQYENIK